MQAQPPASPPQLSLMLAPAEQQKLNTEIDAGVASEDGKPVGDLDPSVYDRDDLTVTPKKGGVGPLTVCALFENVIRAAQKSKEI